MDARKLILTNGFTLRELLRLKTQYLSKKRIVYGREQKVTEDESFELFILLIADLISSGFFWMYVLLVFAITYTYLKDGVADGAAMLFICFFPVCCKFFVCSRAWGVDIILTIKLSLLRLRMRRYKIKPPQIVGG
ncbi:hypothetical protein AAFN90_17855 [Erwiniaceae bacterium CAU 1747]